MFQKVDRDVGCRESVSERTRQSPKNKGELLFVGEKERCFYVLLQLLCIGKKKEGMSNSIYPQFSERHPLYSMSRCGYNGKKRDTQQGRLAAHFVIPRATLPSSLIVSFSSPSLVCIYTYIESNNITETIHQISEK